MLDPFVCFGELPDALRRNQYFAGELLGGSPFPLASRNSLERPNGILSCHFADLLVPEEIRQPA
jgi:hypothetical protein